MTVGCRTGVTCAGCDRPILDRYLLNVMERAWHSECVQCTDCRCKLTEKCFSREGSIYCREDFYRRFGTKCAGCSLGISPSDLVRKAKDKVFHLKCFTCMVCRKQLSTGEELYIVDDDRFMCKSDYCRFGYQGSNDEDGDCEDIQDETGSLQDMEFQFDTEDTESIDNSSDYPEKGNMNVSNDSNEASFGNEEITKLGQAHDLSGSDKVSEDPLSPEDLNDSNGTKCSDEAFSDEKYLNMDENSNDESPSAKDGKSVTGSGGSKRRGPRTTIKAKQLEVLKAAFAANPKPTRHIREQLAKDTGLNMRVIQVWFQNRRSKERRMKQLSIFGNRRNFFNSRRMRGMSLEDGPDVMGPPHMGYFPENERDYFGYDGYGEMFPPHGPEGPQGMGYLPPNAHRIPPMGMNQQLHSPLDHSPDGRYLPENMLPPSSTEQQMHMHPSEMILSSGDSIRALPGRPLFSQPLSHRTEGLGEAW